jgi:hypothetical protein
MSEQTHMDDGNKLGMITPEEWAMILRIRQSKLTDAPASPPASESGAGEDDDRWDEEGISDLVAEAKLANKRMNEAARAALEHRTTQNEKLADIAARNASLYVTELINVIEQLRGEPATPPAVDGYTYPELVQKYFPHANDEGESTETGTTAGVKRT